MLFWFIFPVWKTDGSFGQTAKARPWNRANLPWWNTADKSLIFGHFFVLVWDFSSFFFFLLFWGGNGNFPCRLSLLPKNCCSPGVVERKRCPRAGCWSGNVPAGRDVWLGHAWHPQAGTAGKVRAPLPRQLLGNKFSKDQNAIPVLLSTQWWSPQGSCQNKNKWPMLMLQVSMRWQQGKKKKGSHELSLSSTRI